jgi:Putative DNA-binding domain
MPTLLELQIALYDSLVEGRDNVALGEIVAQNVPPRERLGIHRDSFIASLTGALRDCYPAVDRLVGAAFFDGAARSFIERSPPRSAYLNEYGAQFPLFLEQFAPAASVAYLADVARLEWAVNTAFHAPDVEPLDVRRLARLAPQDHAGIAFVTHPSVTLVRAGYRVDEIWRAVLARDDAGLAAIDPSPFPVRLLVGRWQLHVDVARIGIVEFDFLARLCAARPLGDAVREAGGLDASKALAGHLAAGRFADFATSRGGGPARAREPPS